MVALLLGFAACALRPCMASAPWMYHHDARHTGRYAGTGPSLPLLKNANGASSGVVSSLALASNGVLYYGSADGTLCALNPDLSPRWQTTLEADVWVQSTPAVGADGTIFVGNDAARLYAVAPDGALAWTLPVVGAVAASPIIGADSTVYAATTQGYVYAVHPDGMPAWTQPARLGLPIETAPALASDGTLYVVGAKVETPESALIALYPNGALRWKYAIPGSYVNTAPTVAPDGTIYVGSFDGKLFAVSPNGTARWPQPFLADSAIVKPALGTDGTLYVGTAQGALFALDPNGAAVWANPFQAGAMITCPPIIDGAGTLYFTTGDLRLHAVTAGGAARWTQPFCAYDLVLESPVLAPDGTLYTVSRAGWVRAIGQAPELSLAKSVAANPDGTLTYTLTCDVGAAPATGVCLQDFIPSCVSYAPSDLSPDAIYYAYPGCVEWELGDLPAGARRELRFRVAVEDDAPTNTPIRNVAILRCAEGSTADSNAVDFVLHQVTPSAPAHGAITPSTAQRLVHGGDITFQATPAPGFTVLRWAVDGVVRQQGGTRCTLAGVTADCTVAVEFVPRLFEADLLPGPDGDGAVTLEDWVQIGRWAIGLDTPPRDDRFRRIDCAPRATGGDGRLTLADWVQAGRYATGVDPLTETSGPGGP